MNNRPLDIHKKLAKAIEDTKKVYPDASLAEINDRVKATLFTRIKDSKEVDIIARLSVTG